MEKWKDILGYEGLYQVSNYGRVRSLKYGKEKILKQQINTDGYLHIDLYKNKKRKNYNVHRLVTIAFLENPNNYPQVNHKDENKQNNHIDNLEWCDYKYNCNYGTRNKRRSEKIRGRKHSEETKEKILKKIKKKVICVTTGEVFNSIKEASERYDINRGNISACCKEKTKSSGKYNGEKLVWRYLKNEK